MLLGLISAILTARKATILGKTTGSTSWFAIYMSCTFATDVLITGTSTFFLLQARKSALRHIRKLISGLIKATNSIILVLLDGVPIIYACCMLHTLKTRRSLRLADSSGGLGNSNTNNISSGSRSRAVWRPGGPVELSSMGGVQVHAQIETVDHGYGLDFDSKRLAMSWTTRILLQLSLLTPTS
ncbi:hypothetical protein B0H17DRAFT_1211382 [Mycena rosella]|uniref:Uncharacterized protein n=1 Tax=Mycena rosella TaxID=1033263 RepID=A0AAD7G3N3_MYCRO|nr:hypothetical protein B0H17DRAFT_1211382 [Mycena rosella]